MEVIYPEAWEGLVCPGKRLELLAWLEELAHPDPRLVWNRERDEGLISGIDEVFHYFFDDNDFSVTDVGVCLLRPEEAHNIDRVKECLERILADLPKGGDDDFVQHQLWTAVTLAADEALGFLKAS